MTLRVWRVWITVLAIGSGSFVVGCSGKSDTTAPVTQQPVSTAPAAGGAPSAPVPATANAEPPIDPAHPETKWIGTIPYDVFYDQPLVVASDTTSVNGVTPPQSSATAPATAGTSPSEPSDPSVTSAPATGSTPAVATGHNDWGKIIPLDLALEAVKVARTEMNASLQTVPKYNAGLTTIQQNAALMGMLAVVIAEHPEAANWKAKAKYVRDLCYEIQGKATEKGGAAKQATSDLFEQITTILDGGSPPEKESQDSVPYVEVADRSEMMKIIDKTMNHLKSNIGDAKRMKEQANEVTRDLSVLRALGVMMSDPSYDAADNPEYQTYTKAFIDGAALGVEAVKTDKFDEFQTALNRLNTSCNDCHPKFRSQDSGN
ncbi:MAG: hypothetical protein DWH81_09690 [Planctomycetota bacterium]|nr:MAG: hypothetical protein DWH81_09690 [Planctomycetota bacterium]